MAFRKLRYRICSNSHTLKHLGIVIVNSVKVGHVQYAILASDIREQLLRRSDQRSLLSLLKLRLLLLMFPPPHLFVMVGIGAPSVPEVSQRCLVLCAI